MSIRPIFLPIFLLLVLTGLVAASPTATAQIVAAPQIAFSGNGQAITDGDSTPRPEDGTDFGTTMEGADVVRVFAIRNEGNADLRVSALSVPDGFSVSLIGAPALPATVVPNGSLVIVVRCLAEKAEDYTGFISIESDDPDNGRAGFAIACSVSAPPEIDVAGNATPIANGDTMPSLTDATDFGSTAEDTQVTSVFTISNRGVGDLMIGAVTLPDGFSLLNTPATTLPDGGSTTLEVRCDARDPGAFTGQVQIANNDADENPFSFTIRCLVEGDLDPDFNPSPDDLPPVDPTAAPSRPRPNPPQSRGSIGGGDSNPGAQGGGDTTADSGTQIPSNPAPVSTPTAVPTSSAAATPQANTGGTQSQLRPPSTGDGGLVAP